MTDLAEFLLALVEEDRAIATAARDARPVYGHDRNTAYAELIELGVNEGGIEEAAEHASLFDPARVLAECEAKRRIIASIIDPTVMCEVADDVLRLLALPYADRAGYREEWRP